MGATDHDIYKKRGRMNIQIGLVLAAFVMIVMIATVARLSNPPVDPARDAQTEPTSEVSQ